MLNSPLNLQCIQHAFITRAKSWLSLTSLVAISAALVACGATKAPPAPLVAVQPSTENVLSKHWVTSVWQTVHAVPTVLKSTADLLVPQGNGVASYKLATGAQNWVANIGLVQASIALSDDTDTALALVKGLEAVALNTATGAVLWRTPILADMRTQPAFVAGVFVVLTADGRVIGLNAATGERKWAFARPVPALSIRGTGAIAAIDATTAVLGLPGGKALGINVNNGKIVWETTLASVRGVNDVERIADILPNWVATPGLGVCATVYRQRASCVNSQGQITHQQVMDSTTGLLMSDNRWFGLSDAGSLKTWSFKQATPNADLDTSETAPDWSFDGLRGRVIGDGFAPFSSVVVGDGKVFVADSADILHVLSADTGLTVARAKLPIAKQETAALSPVTLDGKTMVLVATDKHLSLWSVK
jgi:outer membrane protein assembly factor BamB